MIGFCGAPWTVATYMVEGGGSKDHATARLWAYRDPVGFAQLIDIVTETSIDYLSGQITAGAEVVQIFDTWAGSLANDEFETWVVRPTRRIVEEVKARHQGIKVIGFPRAAGLNFLHYAAETGVDGLGCDTSMPLSLARQGLEREGIAVQGNLDPLLLVAGGERMERKIATIVEEMRGAPFVFNLGHGIVPQTPPEHVARLVEVVRAQGAP